MGDALYSSLADELFLGLSVVVIFAFFLKDFARGKVAKIHFVIIVYIFYSIVNALYSKFNPVCFYSIIQSLISIKVFVVSLSMVYLYNKTPFNDSLIRAILLVMSLLFVVGLLANAMLQENWNLMMGYEVSYRYGIIRPAGWYGASYYNAYYFLLTFPTLYLHYRRKHPLTFKNGLSNYSFISLVTVVMSFSLTVRKVLVALVPLLSLPYSALDKNSRVIFIALGIIPVMVVLFSLGETALIKSMIEDLNKFTYTNDNLYIRGLMVYHGFWLFIEEFPFGVGAGTFGTVMSQYSTLDVYQYVGIPPQFFDNGLRGVFDSGLFSLLAENGFLGMVFVAAFLYYFFKYNKSKLSYNNYLIFKIITYITILLSITDPVWQNGVFTAFYCMNLLFLHSANNHSHEGVNSK